MAGPESLRRAFTAGQGAKRFAGLLRRQTRESRGKWRSSIRAALVLHIFSHQIYIGLPSCLTSSIQSLIGLCATTSLSGSWTRVQQRVDVARRPR